MMTKAEWTDAAYNAKLDGQFQFERPGMWGTDVRQYYRYGEYLVVFDDGDATSVKKGDGPWMFYWECRDGE